jgi:hypothetical protein
MNPNTCTVCEMMFTKVMRATKISVDVSVLFRICGVIRRCLNPCPRHRSPPS